MSFESKVKTATASLVNNEFAIDHYEGTAKKYLVLNYQEIFHTFADGEPGNVVQSAQLHLFMPFNENPKSLKQQLAQALISAGFAISSVINASDGDGRHYVFEFEGHEYDLLEIVNGSP